VIARIGIADTGRDIEVVVDSRDELVSRIESAYTDGLAILWLEDTKGNDIGIPMDKIAYVEISGGAESSVGFSM